MARRCSHCSNNGHNSRTCPTRGGGAAAASVRLFGVRLTDGSIIKKSASMGNLSVLAHHHHHHSPSSPAVSPNRDSPLSGHARHVTDQTDGYLSDDPAHGSGLAHIRGERKRGVPWTEEEHRLFLIGLQKLGKGDWRGISKSYVTSRTPTQVASHAQKYFIRQSSCSRRKRRSSLFDMVTDDTVMDTSPANEDQPLYLSPLHNEFKKTKSLPSLDLSLKTAESEPASSTSQERTKEPEEAINIPNGLSTVLVPGLFPSSEHEVLKPIPCFAKERANVEELVCMSRLSIQNEREPSPLSLKLVGEPSKTSSALHSNGSVGSSDLNQGNSGIQAV